MKLKQKLAEEYSDETGDSTDAQGFMAGFEKARELALQEYRKTSRAPLIDRLEKLGEEEV